MGSDLARRWFQSALRALPEPSFFAGRSVCVGLSGGVDSAVAAALLQERGYHVGAAFVSSWSSDEEDREDENAPSCATEEERSAEKVAAHLRVKDFRSYDMVSTYWNSVFTPFLEAYEQGRTPNPDLSCNVHIKFGLLAERAKRDGHDIVATGHYARLRHTSTNSADPNHTVELLRGRDPQKDQTYFLSAVPESSLRHALFPVGALHKTETREVARWLGLPNADRPSSRGLCFIGKRPMTHFLHQYLRGYPGEVRSIDGVCLGQHDGSFHFYSIGQRVPLASGLPERCYVVAKRIRRGGPSQSSCDLVVCYGAQHEMLFVREMVGRRPFWFVPENDSHRPRRNERILLHVLTAYREAPQRCEAWTTPSPCDETEEQLHLRFSAPVRRSSPGQALVLYHGDRCIGGAWLESDDKTMADVP